MFYRLPLSWDKIVEANVGVFAGTPMNTLFWCMGNGHLFHHDTEVGDKYGEDMETVNTASVWIRREHFKQLIREGHDIFQGMVEEGHKIGIEVFASFRMNDFHDSRYPDSLGPFKKEHPEYLLGDSVDVYEQYSLGVNTPKVSLPHKFSVRTCMNYAIPQVREFRMNVMRETVDKYDLDGVELDWSRAPWAFKPGEELRNIEIMNEFTREIRRHLDEKAEKVGRRLYLAAAVPPTFQECLEIGLDVETWLEEGLLDILIVGHFYGLGHPFNMPFEEIREATRKAGCQLFPRLNGEGTQAVMARPGGRLGKGGVLYSGLAFVENPDVFRAAAATHYGDGADGIYLFNFHDIAREALLSEIGDPEALERLDKRYIVPKRREALPSPWDEPYIEFTGSANGLPPPLSVHSTRRPREATEPLPLVLILGNGETGQSLSFQVADDLEGASRDGVLKETKLRLRLINYHPDTDEVLFKLNDRLLSDYDLVDDMRRNQCFFEFSLDGPWVNRGTNRLEAVLTKRNPQVTGKMLLDDIDLSIRYK
jgi:hypothetical protein